MKTYSIAKVREELVGWERIKAVLASKELDPQTLLDTLDGETELHEAILVLEDEIAEHEIMQTGIARALEDLDQRMARHEKTVETLRAVILSAMQTAEIKTIQGATATVSTAALAPQPIIDDESAIPSRFFEAQPPKLDKNALKQALNDKEKIEGAHLSNGGVTLKIRRK
ncbi:MAG: siphovirus Gp157 family protein [Geminicoccaceae bacterium]